MMIPLQSNAPLRDQLPPKPGAPEPRKVPAALLDAVRAEMASMLQGDIEDPQALSQIEKFAQVANTLFAVVRGQPHVHPHVAAYNGGAVYGGGVVSVGGYSNPEQFGARAIRELVGLLPEILQSQKKESPAEIAEAMKIAKEEGDEELRLALRDKLMGKNKKDGVVEAKAIIAHEAHEHHDEHDEHREGGAESDVAGESEEAEEAAE